MYFQERKVLISKYFLLYALIDAGATLIIGAVGAAAIAKSFLIFLATLFSGIRSVRVLLLLSLGVTAIKIAKKQDTANTDAAFKALAALSLLIAAAGIFYSIFYESFASVRIGRAAVNDAEIALLFVYAFNITFLMFRTKYYIVLSADIKETFSGVRELFKDMADEPAEEIKITEPFEEIKDGDAEANASEDNKDDKVE
jgi:hypothetical protein